MAEAILMNRSPNNFKGEMPVVSYTGSWSGLIDDGKVGGVQQWRAKFYTSGKLTFSDLGNAKNGIDLFLVGGGGSGTGRKYNAGGGNGGGGGYAITHKNLPVSAGVSYDIVVGAGGSVNTSYDKAIDGGNSTAFGYAAAGGKGGTALAGGNGGSGGGGGYTASGAGGSNGSNGGGNSSGNYTGGKGQINTTREFGESTGTLYSGGGGGSLGGAGGAGGGGSAGSNGTANTGGGGGGGLAYVDDGYYGCAGGSGIVVIRNAR